MPILIIIILLIASIIFPKLVQYNRSRYKEESGNGFFQTITDPVKYGEFLAFTYLEEYKIYRKLLTDFYLPSADPQLKMELVMLNKAGIYVFDVNNYKGVIRGEGDAEHWTHHYKNKEEAMENPLQKNQKRIEVLKKKFPEIEASAFKSFVLVNDICDLQMDKRDYERGRVLKMNELIKAINEDIEDSEMALSKEEIDNVYHTLKKVDK